MQEGEILTMRKFRTKKGIDVILLNPAEKGRKYAKELRDNRHLTNGNVVKKDDKGKVQKLNKTSRAYRAGYLASRKDCANAYKATHQVKNVKHAVTKATKVHM